MDAAEQQEPEKRAPKLCIQGCQLNGCASTAFAIRIAKSSGKSTDRKLVLNDRIVTGCSKTRQTCITPSITKNNANFGTYKGTTMKTKPDEILFQSEHEAQRILDRQDPGHVVKMFSEGKVARIYTKEGEEVAKFQVLNEATK